MELHIGFIGSLRKNGFKVFRKEGLGSSLCTTRQELGLSGNASVTTPPVLLLSAQSKFQMAIMRLLLATAGHKLHRSIDGCGLV